MKLHLPKALLTAVVAVCGLCSAAQAEGIGNSYDADYTYSGSIYTLDATTAHDSSASGTLSTNVYETTRNDATSPTGWTVSETATVTNTSSKWQSLFYSNDYNTLRISGTEEYCFKFDDFTVGGLIVEEGATGSSFFTADTDATRDITIGSNSASSVINSYFAGSFTLSNTGTKIKTSSVITLQNNQTWNIAEGATVAIESQGNIKNTGTWKLSGGSLNINTTIQNTGSVDFDGTSVAISSDDVIFNRFGRTVETTSSDIEGNGLVTSISDIKLVTNTGEGSCSGTISCTVDSQTVSATNGTTSEAVDLTEKKVYLIANNEIYSSGMSTANKIAVLNDAILTLNESISDTISEGIVMQGETAKVHLGNNGLLNKSEVSYFEAKGTLTGTGTYALGAVTSGTNVYGDINLGSFQGTVTANTGSSGLNLINLNGSIGSEAKVQLTNFTGYLCSSNGGTLNANLILNKESETNTYGLKLQNGASGSERTSTFTGSIEGKGDMAYTWGADSSHKQTHIFQGDTSGWEGKFVRDADDNGKTVVAKFTSGGDVFHTNGTGGVDNKNAQSLMSVVIEADTDTTFNGSINNVASVAVNSNTSFEQKVSTGELTVKDAVTLSVAAGISTETLTLGTDSKLEFDGGGITIANSYEVDASCITLADGITFDSEDDYTLITVGSTAESGIATLSDATLTVTGVDSWSGNGTVYTINNVDYTAALKLADNSLKVKFTALPVPEPTSSMLGLVGLVALTFRRRRK